MVAGLFLCESQQCLWNCPTSHAIKVNVNKSGVRRVYLHGRDISFPAQESTYFSLSWLQVYKTRHAQTGAVVRRLAAQLHNPESEGCTAQRLKFRLSRETPMQLRPLSQVYTSCISVQAWESQILRGDQHRSKVRGVQATASRVMHPSCCTKEHNV